MKPALRLTGTTLPKPPHVLCRNIITLQCFLKTVHVSCKKTLSSFACVLFGFLHISLSFLEFPWASQGLCYWIQVKKNCQTLTLVRADGSGYLATRTQEIMRRNERSKVRSTKTKWPSSYSPTETRSTLITSFLSFRTVDFVHWLSETQQLEGELNKLVTCVRGPGPPHVLPVCQQVHEECERRSLHDCGSFLHFFIYLSPVKKSVFQWRWSSYLNDFVFFTGLCHGEFGDWGPGDIRLKFKVFLH